MTDEDVKALRENKTCADCANLGRKYWGDDDYPIHFCKKSAERRRDGLKPTGDSAEDFMSEFRKFYDASPRWKACKYFEPRALRERIENG